MYRIPWSINYWCLNIWFRALSLVLMLGNYRACRPMEGSPTPSVSREESQKVSFCQVCIHRFPMGDSGKWRLSLLSIVELLGSLPVYPRLQDQKFCPECCMLGIQESTTGPKVLPWMLHAGNTGVELPFLFLWSGHSMPGQQIWEVLRWLVPCHWTLSFLSYYVSQWEGYMHYSYPQLQSPGLKTAWGEKQSIRQFSKSSQRNWLHLQQRMKRFKPKVEVVMKGFRETIQDIGSTAPRPASF